MIRENEARWNKQNAILDKTYGRREILTSKNVNMGYRRSQQMVPTNNAAQQIDTEHEQDTNTPKRKINAQTVNARGL